MFGIVAGLGPRATMAFYSTFMHRVTSKTGGSMPRLIMYNVAMSPHIENTFLQGTVSHSAPQRIQVRKLLNEAVQHFLNNQVTTVAMACNTLQGELETLCQSNGLRNINMIETTAQSINQRNARRVLILGTASTYSDGFYGKYLRQYGIQYVYPNTEQQDFIETYIRSALDQNIDSLTRQQFSDRVRQMIEVTGADGVVLACTDLSGDIDEQDSDFMVFDSLQLLANASAEHALKQDALFV